jgi:hypothetical protein
LLTKPWALKQRIYNGKNSTWFLITVLADSSLGNIKTRPLKIVLVSTETRNNIISRGPRVRNAQEVHFNPKTVCIGPDHTKLEREQDIKLRKELAKKRESDPNWLTNTIFKGLVLMFPMALSLSTVEASFLGGGTSGFLHKRTIDVGVVSISSTVNISLTKSVSVISSDSGNPLTTIKSLLKNVRATQTG